MAKFLVGETTLLLIYFLIPHARACSDYAAQPINLILNTFSHCTTILATPSNRVISCLKWDMNAIIVINEAGNMTQFPIGVSGQPTARAAFVRRNEASKSCWAFILVLPEVTKHPYGKPLTAEEKLELATVVRRGYMPGDNVKPQFYVWLTATKILFQKILSVLAQSHKGVVPFGDREYLLMEVRLDSGGAIQILSEIKMHIHNRQYVGITGKAKSRPWYEINCKFSTCWDKIAPILSQIWGLNKYFWFPSAWATLPRMYELFNIFKIGAASHSQHMTLYDIHQLSKLTSFDEFFAFIIFQDLLPHVSNETIMYTPNFRREYDVYIFRREPQLYSADKMRLVVIPQETYPFRIVSCYQVGTQNSQFRALSDPFDTCTWTILVVSFVSVILFFAIIPKGVTPGWFIATGILLENSVLGEPKTFTRGGTPLD
ncbi:hypothetical protein Fcan01_16269 [Folsomia candida]|uniref:Uncharacterized protein n=1 Tax=Folsomia candida TaxID=158441 RepID=A0A226DUG2_FOLCA|nr:hypothetical protein Fcan01_16269 [Folsomia candida]